VWLDPWVTDWELSLREVTLPELLQAAPVPWDTALLGKWHLARFRDGVEDDPLDQGFGRFAGSLANLRNQYLGTVPTPVGYFNWEKVVDGEIVNRDVYATTDTIDDAVALLPELTPPWLLVVSLNSAHEPLHDPPDTLDGGWVPTEAPDKFAAMLTAADTELGRLLDALPPEVRAETTIIVVSDNGTPEHAIRPPLDPLRGKGTVYEIGVRVPLVVTGPLVAEPGSVSTALVQVTDLFATVAELAQVDVADRTGADGRPLQVDSLSLVPYLRDPRAPSRRSVVFAEAFANGEPASPCGECAVRSATHKLIRQDGADALFLVGPDGLEGDELLADGVSPDEQTILDGLVLWRGLYEDLPFDYAEGPG
jgi:arylsulfatase A-like enzyme